jgi:hypothetical protein
MRRLLGAIAVLATLPATGASAQKVLDLSGRYVCVQVCATGVAGQPAFITQNGWNMNILTEAGVPSRAWIDWPGHIWVDRLQEGAVYSPDGTVIQFDRGTIWQRDLGLPPPPPPPVLRRKK